MRKSLGPDPLDLILFVIFPKIGNRVNLSLDGLGGWVVHRGSLRDAGCWRWFYPDADAGICPGDPNACSCGDRFVRDHFFGWLWHIDTRNQGQCRYYYGIGNADWRSDWRSDWSSLRTTDQVVLFIPSAGGDTDGGLAFVRRDCSLNW